MVEAAAEEGKHPPVETLVDARRDLLILLLTGDLTLQDIRLYVDEELYDTYQEMQAQTLYSPRIEF